MTRSSWPRSSSRPLCRFCALQFLPSSQAWPCAAAAAAAAAAATPTYYTRSRLAPSPTTHVRWAAGSVRNAANGRSTKDAAAAANRAASISLLRSNAPRQHAAAGAVAAEPEAGSLLPDVDRIGSLVGQTTQHFLAAPGIPTETTTLAALNTCMRAAAALKPHVARLPGPNILRLGPADARKRRAATLATDPAARSAALRLRDAVKHVSDAAYAIICHPPVIVTPQVLDLFIDIHALINTAAHLAPALELYGSKPLPHLPSSGGGGIAYRAQNPRRAAAAVGDATAARALQVAVAARDLDSAIGVAEACYDTEAFRRQKLMRQGVKPALALLATPPVVYLLSRSAAQLQNMTDPETFTVVATLGGGAYLTITVVLGLLAHLGNSEKMRRVRWETGTSFWYQWSREEFRAALDDIASAWGFKDASRHGEEIGVEWDGLREYVLLKQMILDRVESMEGMN